MEREITSRELTNELYEDLARDHLNNKPAMALANISLICLDGMFDYLTVEGRDVADGEDAETKKAIIASAGLHYFLNGGNSDSLITKSGIRMADVFAVRDAIAAAMSDMSC